MQHFRKHAVYYHKRHVRHVLCRIDMYSAVATTDRFLPEEKNIALGTT